MLLLVSVWAVRVTMLLCKILLLKTLASRLGSVRSVRRTKGVDVSISATDLQHLERCIELAAEALEDGDEPFGSVLVDETGAMRFEDRNRVKGGDHTRHPEFEIARWAARNLTPAERAACTVYTSGEHCPMCAAAHGWVGLGRIVIASSTEQLSTWLREWGAGPGTVAPLPITQVVPMAQVDGPVDALTERVKLLQHAAFVRRSG